MREEGYMMNEKDNLIRKNLIFLLDNQYETKDSIAKKTSVSIGTLYRVLKREKVHWSTLNKIDSFLKKHYKGKIEEPEENDLIDGMTVEEWFAEYLPNFPAKKK
jgi:predicted transcriptional regulator